jgi:hypothetical protein
MWFKTNLFSFKLDKTNCMHLKTRNSSCNYGNVSYDNKLISNTSTLKFLGLIIDDMLTWKSHIEMIVPKLSAACFTITDVAPYMTCDILKMMNSSYFHPIMNNGLTFWGNSSYSNSILKLQKRIIRIIMGAGTRDSLKYTISCHYNLNIYCRLCFFWVQIRINVR